MKKYIILTSVLALTACGGGSGGDNNIGAIGGIGGAGDVGGVDVTGTPISDITGMRTSVTNKSQVIDAVTQATATTTARKSRAMAPQSNDLDIEYDKAVATINLAKGILAELNSDNVTDKNLGDIIVALHLAGHMDCGETIDQIKSFISNHGFSSNDAIKAIDKIISDATQTIEDVEFHVVGIEDEGYPDTGTLKIKTNGDNIHEITLVYGDKPGKFIMSPLGGQKFHMIITGGDEVEEGIGTVVMLGKQYGLQYADFGYMAQTTIDKDDNAESSREFMTGGYDVMKIAANEMPTEKMEFTGTAVAAMWNDDADLHHNMQDDKATLTFDGGNETLTMNFDKWYNVKISKTDDGSFIAFDGKPVDERLELTTAGTPDNSKLIFETNYYGNGTPSEATASFGYAEGTYDDHNLRGFTGAFGAKK